jgi:hypothetical protein
MRKFTSVVITLTRSVLWLVGTYFASFVVFGEDRGLQQFVWGVAIAGFGALILWYGRAVNRAAAVYILLLGVLLGAISVVLIFVPDPNAELASRFHLSLTYSPFVEHLEFVFVGVVTGVFLWVWRASWKNKKTRLASDLKAISSATLRVT